MPQPTVYSFKDINMVINPPGVASYSIDGQGVGEVMIDYAADNSIHDRAADGKIMISKIEASDGNISVTVQQTSPLHSYLKGVFNLLNAAPSSQWAATNISITSRNGAGDNIILTGVSFAKRAGQPYKAQADKVTWNFMAANIQMNGSVLAAINSSI